MNILGIGPFEILLILIVAFVVLGPKDMAKTGRTIGRFLRKIVMSSEWRAVRQIAHEIQTTPNRLIREAGIEEMEQMRRELSSLDPLNPAGKRAGRPAAGSPPDGLAAWTQPPPPVGTILPPTAAPAAEPSSPDAPPPEA